MKRIFAIWMTAARTVVWKLLLIMILMTGVQTAVFWQALRSGGMTEIQKGLLRWAFYLALIALCAVLCLQGSERSGGKMLYTLRRLPLREETVTVLWALLHVGCIVILWGCQLAVALGHWALYSRYGADGGAYTLELFALFYTDGFLHGLLPLADIVRHVRNIFWILSLGFSTASFGYFQRRGRFRMETLLLLAVGLYTFGVDLSNIDLSVLAVGSALVLMGTPVYSVYSMWEVCHETD